MAPAAGLAAACGAFAWLLQGAAATGLPFVHATGGHSEGDAASLVRKEGQDQKWWARVGDRVYHTPSSNTGLSANVSDYYVALGSESALTDDMKQHVVGGSGRWHIMHLPEGPAMVEVAQAGARRSSLSQLTQLTHGMVLSSRFPAYSHATAEILDATRLSTEAKAASFITTDAVMGYLNELVSFPTRSYSNETAQQQTQAFLQRTFSELGFTTCLHSFESQAGEQKNIVAYVPGSGRGTVVVGAHYDSRPFEGAAPGAEDNGSGVAALLAIARAFKKANVQPKKSVYFVAFAAEEAGLWGSQAFVQSFEKGALPADCSWSNLGSSFLQGKHFHFAARDHVAILMDEVGWRSPKYSDTVVNLEATDWAGEVMDELAQANKVNNGDAVHLVHNNHPFGSDHMSFLNERIQAVLVINGDDEAYPNYHQSTDTVSNVSPDMVVQVGKLVLGGALRLSERTSATASRDI